MQPPTRARAAAAHPSAPQAGSAATTFCVALLFGTESYSHKSALKVLIVGLGVVIASYGDVRANFFGVALQVAAIVADAVRCTLLQLVMQTSDVKLTPVGTLYHVAPMAAATLAVPALLLEGAKLRAHPYPIPYAWLAGSCLAASSLNLVVFTLIGKTSALTTSVTGPLKEWVCILTAMLIYNTSVTAQQWCGYAIALCGIFWYQVSASRTLGAPPSSAARPASAAAARRCPPPRHASPQLVAAAALHNSHSVTCNNVSSHSATSSSRARSSRSSSAAARRTARATSRRSR